MVSSNITAQRQALIQHVYLRESAVLVLRSDNQFERSREDACSMGQGVESMIVINQFRWTAAPPGVAQLYRLN
jgi:hypothetical protein